ncbi:hypothetical protein AGMMS50262_12360 [Bacteroidia bacterium]|nr:hypothetical protein AGMMS50262_12360 [Bacteroidia bacterium]
MNEKKNLQDLISLLAEKSGITKKEAEIFLRELFRTLDESIFSDQSVKIKSLGTFKLVLVDNRESVNVTTGERVLIPAHYKIGYTPDTRLSEKINLPFALFESMEMPDEITEENENYREIIIEKPPVSPIVPSDSIPQSVIDNFEQYQELQKIRKANDGQEKRRHRRKRKDWRFPWKWLLVLLAIGGVFWLYRTIEKEEKQEIQSIMYSFSKPKNQTTKPDTDTLPLPTESILLVRPDTVDTVKKIEKPAEQPQKPVPAPAVAVKKRTIHPGEMLTVIALEEYGNKIFWVYLYLENQNIIANPNNVPAGTTIVIPPASKYDIDANDPASVREASERMRKILQQ